VNSSISSSDHRRYLAILFGGWLVPSVLIIASYLFVDPYRIFHKPWLRDGYYINLHAMRAEAAGVINTGDFDSVIIGSSMAENFSASEASSTVGGRFANISLSGSSHKERAVVLDYLFSRRAVRNVILSLDPGSFEDSIGNAPIARYLYLYDGNRINDLKIYMSLEKKVLRYLFCRNRIFESERHCRDVRNNQEMQTNWYYIGDNKNRFGGVENWYRSKGDLNAGRALVTIVDKIGSAGGGLCAHAGRETDVAGLIRTDILRFAESWPGTRFYLFFPPYSRLNYALQKQIEPCKHAHYENVVKETVRQAGKYGNVSVFGFEGEDFLDDLANYKDTSHYHPRFNSMMLDWMAAGVHRLSVANVDGYIDEISSRAEHYPLQAVGRKLKGILQSMDSPDRE
jgi:hypothetical protein